jgi:hypothetical protein
MNAVTHLATTLQLSQSLQVPRNISAIHTGRGDSGGRGRGRGQGREGGRGRGRGRNIYLGSYTPDQWRKLSSDNKKRVIDGHQKSADGKSSTGTTPGIGGNRNLSSIITDDVQSILTGTVAGGGLA